MGMLDDDLDEGVRATNAYMRAHNCTWEEARTAVVNAPNYAAVFAEVAKLPLIAEVPPGTRETIAAAIANARGGRRGMPPIVNILDVLPEKLRNEVLDDADHVLKALGR